MQKARETFLIKAQAEGVLCDYASAITQLATVAPADFIEVGKGSEMHAVVESTDVETVSGPMPSQNPAVPGSEMAAGSLVVPITGFTTGKIPAFVRAMTILGGMDDTQSGQTGSETAHTLEPGLSLTPALILKASGPNFEGKVLEEAFYNCLADWDIEGNVNKHAFCTFKVGGAALSEQDAAECSTIHDYMTADQFAPDSVAAPSFKSATVLITNTLYNVISFKISANAASHTHTNSAEVNGAGTTAMTGRAIKTSFKIYAETALAVLANHPMALWRTAALSALQLTWGSASGTISIFAASHQITKVTESDEGGSLTFDVEGLIVGNAIAITVGTPQA